jgi:prolyl oligopeptidase
MKLPRQFMVTTMLLLMMVFVSLSWAQTWKYPKTRKIEHVDTYFATKVVDPYRWLEDDTSPETTQWVAAQNQVTTGYLDKIPYREQLKSRMEKIFNYPKYTLPTRRNDSFFFFKNNGLQNQSVLYVQKGLDGKPEQVLDPNTFSADGTSRLGGFSISKDGKYIVYGVSQGGSDWQQYRILDVTTRQNLPDTLDWIKASAIAWFKNGFFYSRYPTPEKGKELSSKNENHQVFYHRLGTPQSADQLAYEDKANPQRFHFAGVTEDERYALLSISDRGKGKTGNAVHYIDFTSKEHKLLPIIAEPGDFDFNFIDTIGDKFLFSTNYKAPNNRLILIDPKNPDEKNWQEFLAEKSEPLDSVTSSGGKLFLTYLKDVTSRVYVYNFAGKLENEVSLPGLGTVAGFNGFKDDPFVFFTYTSFNSPPSIFRYEIANQKSSLFRAPEIDFKPSDYEVKQVFYPSKDGTKVPMFIVHKKGIKLDGSNPTLLYGYGGFNVNVQPNFDPLLITLYEQGFVYAVANLRGGNEYGEKWHNSGMLLNKQNVFDDFISAGEYLIKEKYTSSNKLAIQGRSNGGLLIGAVINQRPDLFKVAIPQVGVMDMLRFQRFTIGWNWIAEYGSSERNEAEFQNLYRYSPLHNIKPGANYPATLITTADHDDRVVPAHSFKYAATLQEKYQGENPVLIRIYTNSGHGASSTKKRIEEFSDVYSFMFYNLGVTPRY